MPGPTWPSAVYGWGVVVESLESADLPLIDDSVCGSLPVRALNLGRRESFGHEEGRASRAQVRCFWSSYCHGGKARRDRCSVWCNRDRGVNGTPGSRAGMSNIVSCPCCHWLVCCFLYLYLFTTLFLSHVLCIVWGHYNLKYVAHCCLTASRLTISKWVKWQHSERSRQNVTFKWISVPPVLWELAP